MTRILVLQQGRDIVAGWTIGALFAEARSLRAELGVELALEQVETVAELPRRAEAARFDILFVVTHWQADPEQVRAALEQLHASARHLVYVDTFDPTSSPVFGILPWVDLYLKKQLLRDRQAYTRPVRGGYVFADYCARQGLDLADWSFGSLADADQLEKLELGWNLGSAPHLRKRLRYRSLLPARSWQRRNIDVHYRVSIGDETAGDWYTWHRRGMLEAARSLDGLAVVAEAGVGKRLTAAQFRRELGRSRAVLSPLGYGEVTDRDFEVVVRGAVLIKPDVSHLETLPDIYRAGETYVPLAWDLSDAEQRCRAVLADPEGARAMTAAALDTYRRWFREGGLVQRMAVVLERLGIAAPRG